MELRVRQLRKERGLTLVQLSERAGLSVSHLSDIETGKRQINASRLEALAKALGVAPVDLLADRSVSDEINQHLDVLRQLSPEDRAAVLRHAKGLLGG